MDNLIASQDSVVEKIHSDSDRIFSAISEERSAFSHQNSSQSAAVIPNPGPKTPKKFPIVPPIPISRCMPSSGENISPTQAPSPLSPRLPLHPACQKSNILSIGANNITPRDSARSVQSPRDLSFRPSSPSESVRNEDPH